VPPLATRRPARQKAGERAVGTPPPATASPAPAAPRQTPATGGGGVKRSAQDVGRDDFQRCMNDWDAGTHITRKRWTELCNRLKSRRAEGRKAQ
jgi:hypothetical protein